MNAIQKSFFRADVYRILALGFDIPTQEHQNEMRAIIEDLLENVELPELKVFLKILKTKPEKLEEEYTKLFVTKVECPFYEGSYHLAERGPVLGDITAFYNAFHIKAMPMEGPPDAIKMELGFLSFMALKEANAIQNKSPQDIQITEAAEAKFIEDHLGRWGEMFAERLQESTDSPFYIILAKFLKNWIKMECKHWDIKPVRLPSLLPQTETNPVQCSF